MTMYDFECSVSCIWSDNLFFIKYTMCIMFIQSQIWKQNNYPLDKCPPGKYSPTNNPRGSYYYCYFYCFFIFSLTIFKVVYIYRKNSSVFVNPSQQGKLSLLLFLLFLYFQLPIYKVVYTYSKNSSVLAYPSQLSLLQS